MVIDVKNKMPRNTQGGKNFKKFKTGSEGYRAKASREAVDDMIDLIVRKERSEKATDQRSADAMYTAEDKEAARYMVVGRVLRKFGNARVEAYCHDGKTRQCKIRGLLRKKGQVFIDNDSLVVISLREAESSSEDETGVGAGGDVTGTSDIIGCFDDRQSAILRKTAINPRLFQKDTDAEPVEDLFDRSDIINAGNTIEEMMNIDDI